MVRRQKIQAYLARINAKTIDPFQAGEAARNVSKAYSGFVHAASPHIMDMFGGNPARFHVRGMKGTERQAEHSADLWNCFYRSIGAFAIIAKAFGDDDLFSSIYKFLLVFEQESGSNYSSKEWEHLA